MSRRQRAEAEPEEPSGGSAAAGAVVLTVLGTGAAGGIVAVSQPVGILGLWAVGTGVLWWALRRPTKIENHSPPPPGPPSPNAKPQFSIVEDREGHCAVVWKEVNEA